MIHLTHVQGGYKNNYRGILPNVCIMVSQDGSHFAIQNPRYGKKGGKKGTKKKRDGNGPWMCVETINNNNN